MSAKRKSSKKVPVEPDEQRAANKGWSNEDKTNLLAALRQYGHTDIDSISTMIPNKSKPAIKIMIHKIMQNARPLSNSRNSALDTWLKLDTFKDKTPPIPEALKYIALFEEHPSPEESGGFDFRAAYDYLYRMTLGHPAIDVPAGTLEKLNEMMDKVRTKVWPEEESNVIAYLGQMEKKNHALKCYPPVKRLRRSEKLCLAGQKQGANS